jgi:hypothetical protein
MPTGKKYVFILSLCFLITALFSPYPGAQEVAATPSDQQEAESTPGSTNPEKVPHIAIDAANYNVGEIYEGETIVHTFTVTNTGTAELTIKDVKAG